MTVSKLNFNKSLEDLPKHAIVVDRMSGLEEIASQEFNLVIFPREYCEIRADFARLIGPSAFYGSVGLAYDGLYHSPVHPAKKSFLEDFIFLADLMNRLQEGTRVAYEPTHKIHHGAWH